MADDEPRSYEFVLFADYFQFSIEDEEARPSPSEYVETVDGTIADMISPGRGFVNFATVRNTNVPVSLRIEAGEPPADLDAYDHVAEASVEFPSGRLMVMGLGEYSPDAARVDVEPGSYRARILCRGLDTLDTLGLDGDDSYTVVVWRAAPSPPRVLKRHEH
jgi:hypothetical protein